MARPIVLSNNQIFVGLDKYGLVNDFYFPFVGQENLTTARDCHHKIGIYVDGIFSWINDGNWIINLNYETNCLISSITMENKSLHIKLEFNDYIDPDFDAFIRRIKIINQENKQREIRIFMHQVFIISADGRADTVLYVPDKHYVYNYKGKTSLIINGKFSNGTSFDQYAMGNYHVEGKIGTYKDAEDGELSNNPIEHSSVDSTIRFTNNFDANESLYLDYWIIAATNQLDARDLNEHYMNNPMDNRLSQAKQYWQTWSRYNYYPDFKYKNESIKSALIIKAHIDNRGSIIASGDSSIFNYGRDYYAYCWPRDACFALWPLIRLGHFDEAKNFFEFCKSIIHPDGYLLHKYQPDRSIGSTWLPLIINGQPDLAIQEDETAIVLFMLEEYLNTSNDINFVETCYDNLIVPIGNFMSSYIDDQTGLPHASYDLWEEKFLTSTYTVSAVIAGLTSAINLSHHLNKTKFISEWKITLDKIKLNFDKLYDDSNGYYIKGFLLKPDGSTIKDLTIDISSLYGIFMFAKLKSSDQKLLSTAKTIEDNLFNVTPSNGVIRYKNDSYFRRNNTYPGNPWIVTTLWLVQFYIMQNNLKAANNLLEWVINKQTNTGSLGEQYDAEASYSISVEPLVWSQAELINTILDINLNT